MARRAACLGSRGRLRRPRVLLRLGRVVVGDLLLVLAHQALELVGQRVDRRVHVGLVGHRMDRVAAHVQGRLGLVSQLLHREDPVRVDHLVEMAHDALAFLLQVAAQGGGDLDVMAGDAQVHGVLL
jgi:hypothetical protein